VSDGPRYAIYFVPAAETELYRFGSAILGYDCYTGAEVAHATDLGLDPAEREELTREPRQYGFHATLKAPFYLSPSCSEVQLASALESFAALGRVVPVITPAVRVLGGFVAIVPDDPCPDVDTLAADCVTIFDAFRAPMSAAERARRMASGLGQSQISNLDRWGYPYLFDEFRFHMTLTGRVRSDRRHAVLAALQDAFVRRCGDHPIRIDRLVLVRQDHRDARFGVVRHFSLDAGR
jgi:putative phosphonate metabolism protein